MLDTLLESRARTRRSPAGAVVSVCAHTLLIGAAVYATAHAHLAPPVHNDGARPIYFVRPDKTPATPTRSATRSTSTGLPHRPTLKFFDIPTIDVKVPALMMTDPTTSADDFAPNHFGVGASSGLANAPTNATGSAFQADEVEKQVALKPGNPTPLYPPALRNTGVEGKVIAMFVVNELGQAEDSTVRFVSSDNRLFDDAVRTALRRMRFVPAQIGGKKVRQLVQMPFVFTLQK
jgi:periplasmic protein TonB